MLLGVNNIVFIECLHFSEHFDIKIAHVCKKGRSILHLCVKVTPEKCAGLNLSQSNLIFTENRQGSKTLKLCYISFTTTKEFLYLFTFEDSKRSYIVSDVQSFSITIKAISII